jgi:hypothetical protein
MTISMTSLSRTIRLVLCCLLLLNIGPWRGGRDHVILTSPATGWRRGVYPQRVKIYDMIACSAPNLDAFPCCLVVTVVSFSSSNLDGSQMVPGVLPLRERFDWRIKAVLSIDVFVSLRIRTVVRWDGIGKLSHGRRTHGLISLSINFIAI